MPFIAVKDAISKLVAGELVAIPTETVYGLAGRMDREDALRAIFTTKSRPFFDPLIVHVSDAAQARNLTRSWPDIYDVLTREFWPGPLTLIAEKSDSVSGLITAGLDSVGLRSPSHPLAREILAGVGVPLAAPSANRFGRTSPTRAEHVIQEFNDSVDVVDGGPCDVGVESTVLVAKWSNRKWQVEILRPGGISQKDVGHILNREKIQFSIGRAHSVASPGHTLSHYQPQSPVVILSSEVSDADVIDKLKKLDLDIQRVSRLELPQDAVLAARVLYQKFRDLSAPESAIVIKKSSKHLDEDWHAVWDRIERAAILHL